ncbi:thioredoxin domain-containing protein [Aquimarina litoralis]|uniref:thioredoxin domain-containing protein n=1 Tax=Aquimarina litoralis TaxID=584605 RepID=UPI001C576A22|nr:thioredoxin domain-containing protein [Aquimarina litoralis]MBW1297090.1 hypothetical protein [Aquimarina litoralis]
MKTTIQLLFIVLLGSSCYSQTFNQETVNEKGVQNLTGKINFERLNSSPYNTWFSANYESYTPNEKVLQTVKKNLHEYTIKIFMGTWCGDSKREVPRFYKILNTVDFPLDRLTCVAVQSDREHYKQSIGGEHEGLNIHRVPTFIFYKDGKEINRIVEEPKNTLEEDIKAIISDKYTPNYSSVSKIHALLSTEGSDALSKNQKKLIRELSKITESMYELNTFANVLFFDGKQKEAISVLKLNTLLFPKEANTYVSLANKFLIMNNITEAIDYYERSIALKKNTEISNKIMELKKSL